MNPAPPVTMIMGAGYTVAAQSREGGRSPPRPRRERMTERPRFFDDLAGVAGGAFSALAGLREEAEAVIGRGSTRRSAGSTW